jgi:hypothetical protein
MEIRLRITEERATELKQARINRGAIDVSISALIVGYNHAVTEKNAAIDCQDFEDAATWRDNEKNLMHGIANLGLAQPDSDVPETWPITRVT